MKNSVKKLELISSKHTKEERKMYSMCNNIKINVANEVVNALFGSFLSRY